MSVRWAVRAYRWALRLLPRGFRASFGEQATRDFASAAERARRRKGRSGVALATLQGVGDVVRRAPGERWHELRTTGTSKERWTMMWLRETRAAAKGLARRPGFSAVVILTLALGIGATVAIFTVVNTVLIRPLAYPDADRIVTVQHHAPGLDLPDLDSSQGLANFYWQNAHALQSFALFSGDSRNLTGAGPAARVRVAHATPSLFDVLGVQPFLGRAFSDDDVGPDGPTAAVLLNDTWVSRYGSDPGVLGRTMLLDGSSVEIVGVMPEEFEAPTSDVEILLPLRVERDAEFGTFGLTALGRLAPGVSLDDTRAELRELQPRIAEFFPGLTPEFLEQARWSVTVQTLRDRIVGDVRTALWVVMGTVGFVLLIACANVANLFLVRAEGRQREVAIRAAMGAGRGRLAVTFLSESLVLGAVAGSVGLLAATWG
ncbi:MAG TPA: ABC transporter permease, partial [Longimicrobiales bacterium]|nr:ABC transporter permease [Longimicrobiales bacterium]